MATVGAVTSGLTATVKTAAYQSLPNDLVLANATTAAFTVTLPSSPIVGTTVAVKKTDTSANVVTVVGYASSKIDGDPSALLTSQDSAATFTFDGANWQVSSTAVLNVASGGGGGSSSADVQLLPPGLFQSGYWYDRRHGSFQPNAGVSFVAPGVSTTWLMPHFLPRALSITALGMAHNAAPTAGAMVRFGTYSCDEGGLPGVLLTDFGVLARTATASSVDQVSVTGTLPKGWFYMAVACNSIAQGTPIGLVGAGAPTPLQGTSTFTFSVATSNTLSAAKFTNEGSAAAPAALPAVLPALTYTASSINTVNVFFKVA